MALLVQRRAARHGSARLLSIYAREAAPPVQARTASMRGTSVLHHSGT